MRVNLVRPVTVKLSSQRGGVVIWQKVTRLRAVPHVIPPNPRTRDQQAVRGFMAEAKGAWATLEDRDKAQWSAFAEKSFILNSRYFCKRWRGIDAFCRASVARQVAGHSARPELPEGPRPSPVELAELLPGADPHELSFSVTHDLGDDAAGQYRLLVRMTPSASTYARRPYDKQLRYARGTGPQSVAALPESGSAVTMSGVRFALVPGMNYAVELRILRIGDGAVSDAYYQIGRRQESAPASAPSNSPPSPGLCTENVPVHEPNAALAAKSAVEPMNRLNSKLMKRILAAEAAERALDPSAPDWQLGCSYFPAWTSHDDHYPPRERERGTT